MADLPTRAELMQRGKAAGLGVANTRISPKEFDRDGSDANLLLAVAALMGEMIVHRGATALSGNFEKTAKGQRLDRVVFDRKNLPRKPASPAVGTIQISRPTFAAGAGSVAGGRPGTTPTPVRIVTNTGVVYFLTQTASFGATDLGPITVAVEAELAGLASEVQKNQAWSFVDTVFDQTFTIANAADMAGGSDDEGDEPYRSRARDFFPSLRRGIVGAIEFGARGVSGVESVAAIEITDPTSGFPVHFVQLFVMDALGQSNAQLAARVQLELVKFRAFGVPVQVLSAVPEFVAIRSIVAYDTAIVLDTNSAEAAWKSAVVAALNNQQPGARLYRATITSAQKSVPGVVVSDTSLITPAGDLIPSTINTAFRTLPELITTS